MERFVERLRESLRVGHLQRDAGTAASGGEWDGYRGEGANEWDIIFKEGQVWRMAAGVGWREDRGTHVVHYILDHSGTKPHPWLFARGISLWVSADWGRSWVIARPADPLEEGVLCPDPVGLLELPSFTLDLHDYRFADGELTRPRRPIEVQLEVDHRRVPYEPTPPLVHVRGEILGGKLLYRPRPVPLQRGYPPQVLRPPLPGNYHVEILAPAGAPVLAAADLDLQPHDKVQLCFDGGSLRVIPRLTGEEQRAAKKRRLEEQAQRRARARAAAAASYVPPSPPPIPDEPVVPRDEIVEGTIASLFRVAYKYEEPWVCEHGEYAGMTDEGSDGWCLLRREAERWVEVLNPEWLPAPEWHRLYYAPTPPGSNGPRFWLFAEERGTIFASPDGGVGWLRVHTLPHDSDLVAEDPGWFVKLPCVRLAPIGELPWEKVQEPRIPTPLELRLDFQAWRDLELDRDLSTRVEAAFLGGTLRYTHFEFDARRISRVLDSPLVFHLPAAGRYRLALDFWDEQRRVELTAVEVVVSDGQTAWARFDGRALWTS